MILYEEVRDNVKVLLGNRDDLDLQIKIWVNHALTFLFTVHAQDEFFRIGEKNLPVGSPPKIAFPESAVAVNAVSYYHRTELKWKRLTAGSSDVFLETLTDSEYPIYYRCIGREIWFSPAVTEATGIRIMFTRAIEKVQEDTDEIELNFVLQPSLETLAASFGQLHLGNNEVAGTLKNLSQMLGSISLGPRALGETEREQRLSVVVGESYDE